MSQASATSDPVSAAPTSSRRRAVFVTGLLIVLGLVPGMGLPGALMLDMADRLIIGATGSTAMRAIGEGVWPLAIIITILLPLPLVPALGLVGKWRSAGVGLRLFAVICIVAVWGLALSLIALSLAVRQ